MKTAKKERKEERNIELFRKRNRKPLALLFVDYEHW